MSVTLEKTKKRKAGLNSDVQDCGIASEQSDWTSSPWLTQDTRIVDSDPQGPKPNEHASLGDKQLFQILTKAWKKDSKIRHSSNPEAVLKNDSYLYIIRNRSVPCFTYERSKSFSVSEIASS